MPTVAAGRDPVELAQRLEMRYGTLTLDVGGHNSRGFGDFHGLRGRGGNYEIDFRYLTGDMTSPERYDVLVLHDYRPLTVRRDSRGGRPANVPFRRLLTLDLTASAVP